MTGRLEGAGGALTTGTVGLVTGAGAGAGGGDATTTGARDVTEVVR